MANTRPTARPTAPRRGATPRAGAAVNGTAGNPKSRRLPRRSRRTSAPRAVAPGRATNHHHGEGVIPSILGLISRRGFLKGAAVTAGSVAVVSAAGAGLSGCSGSNDDQAAGPGAPTVVDNGAATQIIADDGGYTYQDNAPGLKEAGSWTVPLGTVLRPGEGDLIPCTTTAETANPIVSAGVFSLSSGAVTTVVDSPRSKGANYVIYDVRCSDSVYAWVELDTVSSQWTLYGCGLAGGALQGTPSTLYSGDGDWDLPTMACSGNQVVWLVEPSANGTKTTEASTCYSWSVGQSEAKAQITSPGRFGCAPTISGGVLVLVPRVREDEGVYYGVTAYTLGDDLSDIRDQLTLPASVKPFSAVWIGGRLVFQIEANYASGGLLGQMGTYVSMGDGKFVALSREPAAPPAGKGDLLIVKSRSSYVVADIAESTYGMLTAQDRSVDYGEYPAREGDCDTFVTFSTVKDASSGYPTSVQVRAFSLESQGSK